MAYLALYRKWRPRTFTEVVGQKHISIPLERAIEQDRLAHAYLFSGPRGTGKTSMAKILAKAVNCLNPQGVNPCNECRSCREINNGSSLDVYEIDAASNRGIEEIRALKESVQTLPAVSRKKVYIIDEVHMLTKEAFNALLKTLEEPPSHVLFILATTEPEKIPLTILSRCQRYEFHRISVEDIRNHLLYIAKESGLSLTEEAADLIAVRADGGLRDALSLLDQCSSASESRNLDAKEVYELLGLTGKDRILELSHHIFNGKSSETLALFYSILQEGKEPSSILQDLLEHFRNLMICKVNPKAPELSAYGEKIDIIRSDASRLTEPYLDSLFDYLHQSLSEAKRSSTPRLSAEMGLLHLCRIRGSRALDSLVERVEQLEKEVESLKKGVPVPVRQIMPGPGLPDFNAPQASFTPVPTAAPVPKKSEASGSPIKKPLKDGTESHSSNMRNAHNPPADSRAIPASPAPSPAVSSIPAPQTSTKIPVPAGRSNIIAQPKIPENPAPVQSSTPGEELVDPSSYTELWKKVLSYFMSIHRIDVYTCLMKSTLIYCTRTRAIVSAPQQFLVIAGNNKSYQNVAAEAFNKIIGSPVRIRTVLKGSAEESEALTMLKEARNTQASRESTQVQTPIPQTCKDEYRPINRDHIPDVDRNDPSLKEALKIMADCDIYEKD